MSPPVQACRLALPTLRIVGGGTLPTAMWWLSVLAPNPILFAAWRVENIHTHSKLYLCQVTYH